MPSRSGGGSDVRALLCVPAERLIAASRLGGQCAIALCKGRG